MLNWFYTSITAQGICDGDRVPELMLFLQPLITEVVWHRLPRRYYGPEHPFNSTSVAYSVYSVNVVCLCNLSVSLKSSYEFSCHTRSKFHQRHLQYLGYDIVDLSSAKKKLIGSFFQNGACITCCPYNREKLFQPKKLEIHLHTPIHTLSLYLQSIALNQNNSDPYNIEVQCPFLCPFRFTLYNLRSHHRPLESSGQYTTIYCNILRLIRPELFVLDSPQSTSFRDLLQLLIPHRILGDPMFSIDDVCDENGRQRPVDILDPNFKTGTIGKLIFSANFFTCILIGLVRTLTAQEISNHRPCEEKRAKTASVVRNRSSHPNFSRNSTKRARKRTFDKY